MMTKMQRSSWGRQEDNKEEEDDQQEIDCKRTKEKVAYDILPSPSA